MGATSPKSVHKKLVHNKNVNVYELDPRLVDYFLPPPQTFSFSIESMLAQIEQLRSQYPQHPLQNFLIDCFDRRFTQINTFDISAVILQKSILEAVGINKDLFQHEQWWDLQNQQRFLALFHNFNTQYYVEKMLREGKETIRNKFNIEAISQTVKVQKYTYLNEKNYFQESVTKQIQLSSNKQSVNNGMIESHLKVPSNDSNSPKALSKVDVLSSPPQTPPPYRPYIRKQTFEFMQISQRMPQIDNQQSTIKKNKVQRKYSNVSPQLNEILLIRVFLHYYIRVLKCKMNQSTEKEEYLCFHRRTGRNLLLIMLQEYLSLEQILYLTYAAIFIDKHSSLFARFILKELDARFHSKCLETQHKIKVSAARYEQIQSVTRMYLDQLYMNSVREAEDPEIKGGDDIIATFRVFPIQKVKEKSK